MQLQQATEERLFNWGQWARAHNLGLGTVGTLGNLQGSTVNSLMVTDSEAEIVDRFVAKLISRDSEMGKAVKYYYFNGYKYRKIGLKLEINKDKVQRLVCSGVAWIDAALFFHQTKAA